jgi:hypothetical protein
MWHLISVFGWFLKNSKTPGSVTLQITAQYTSIQVTYYTLHDFSPTQVDV